MNRKQRRARASMVRRGLITEVTMTEQEIRTQYGQACAEAGELQYKIKQLSKSLEDINGKIELLNQQYVDLLNKKKAEETKDVPAQS